jgi:Ca2+-transporting ATPase
LAETGLGGEHKGRVVPVHGAVPGRARFHAEALRGNEVLKSAVERMLPGAAIKSASASRVTGNVLVHFGQDISLAEISARIEEILRNGAGDATSPIERPDFGKRAWHGAPATDVLLELETTRSGLAGDVARRRLEQHGGNTMPPLIARSRLGMLVEQFQSLPVILLAGAAILSLATGGLADALVILGVVGLNAAIGFATESRTSSIIGTLSLPTQASVPVRRDGAAQPVRTEAVVPGDIMLLQPGVIIAADGRVIAADGLAVDESMLTGESLPVNKGETPVPRDRPLAERSSMVFRSTAVVGGSGLAVAVATGPRSEAGQIQALVGVTGTPQTPMQRQLGTLGGQLVLLSGAVCGAVFLIGLLRGQSFLQMLKSAIALAVAAIPEGLPTVGTTALALGIEQMRRRHVLVRRLGAVETLAAVDVIAFDKTGTLTENRMAVAAVACPGEHFAVIDGALYREHRPLPAASAGPALMRLLEVAALCNEASLQPAPGRMEVVGSPTEAALLRLALDLGVDAAALRRRFPVQIMEYRAEGRQYMVSVHAAPRGRLLASKGNPEQVLGRCAWQLRRRRRAPLGRRARAAILADNRKMAAEGLRVLGLAYAAPAPLGHEPATEPRDRQDLVWLGLVGLSDPARRGAGDLLARFDRAGIRVIMMTGDQAPTARAVAQSLNLANGAPVITLEAGELQDRDDGAVEELVRDARIFARAMPADKLRIVQALQRGGKTVAVTGDGINDSPALRAANVGIVMGRSGTDAAREVADIVLASDDLPTLVNALAHGRTTYGNVRKATRFLLATNLSEIVVVLVATALGFGSMLTPMQLLWINLLSDVLPALGLALEPAESDVLEQQPRAANEPILKRQDIALLAREGVTIAAGALGAYGLEMARHGDAVRASTASFTSLVGAQLLHALTSRSASSGLFGTERMPTNRPLATALFGSAGLQAALLVVPGLRRLMGLAPLDAGGALVGLAGALLPYVANELAKTARPRH